MASSSWLVLCVAVLYASALAQGQCHESQRSLLLQLKHDFNTTHWGNKIKSWGPTQDCCGWAGVTCTNGYVTGLDLSGEGIEAVLNASSPLFELRYLTTLNLENNIFGATTIPPSFAKLGNLVHLNLSTAGFVGQIPIEISTLTRLETLDITAPYFFGLKVDNPNVRTLVGNMPNLVKLRLSFVDLSTQSRDWCQVLSSSAPHLQLLDLSTTGLSGPIHPSPCSLETVDISGNCLHGSIPKSLGNCGELEVLDLSYNKLENAIPYELGLVSGQRFKAINVSHNELTGPIPTSFGNLTLLESLDLADNKLSGSIPEQLASLTFLSYFNVSNNQLMGKIPKGSQFRKFTRPRSRETKACADIH